MYDKTRKSKIKNTKIQNWRLELSGFHFEVLYRPGKFNVAADALTQNEEFPKTNVNSVSIEENLLCKLRKELG